MVIATEEMASDGKFFISFIFGSVKIFTFTVTISMIAVVTAEMIEVDETLIENRPIVVMDGVVIVVIVEVMVIAGVIEVIAIGIVTTVSVTSTSTFSIYDFEFIQK